MTRHIAPAAAMFTGASGNTLSGDVYGEEGPPVLLLHGGGQTRHAWKKTGELIARMGRVAYAGSPGIRRAPACAGNRCPLARPRYAGSVRPCRQREPSICRLTLPFAEGSGAV